VLALGRRLPEFVPRIPKELPPFGTGAGKVGTRDVDHRQLQSLAFGLTGTRNADVHAIRLIITIRIELRLHPQVMPNPIIGIFKRFHNLSFAILEDRNGGIRAV
jgi:hypothetical protein